MKQEIRESTDTPIRKNKEDEKRRKYSLSATKTKQAGSFRDDDLSNDDPSVNL